MERKIKKLALLIGNNDYEDGQKLHCSINDALDVGNLLDKIGFHVTIGVDLTYTKMMLKFLEFQRQIDQDDLVIIFYSGHGIQWQDQNYFVPIDNQCFAEDSEMYRYHAIHVQMMLESIEKRQPCAVIFLLDCCRNYLIKNVTLSNMSLTSMKCLGNSMIVFACGSNESAIENSKNGRNSLFTYYLLKHLAESNLTVDEIMCRVCNEIFQDNDGKLCPTRLSSLRTPNIYFNNSKNDDLSSVCIPLPSIHRNQKLEEQINAFDSHLTVDLRNENLIDDDMNIVVGQAVINKQCKRLFLQHNKITSNGMSRIATTLNNNMTLETLNLFGNHISDMGVKYLSEINNSILRVLDLGSNEITDLGVQYLVEMLKINQSLVYLSLSFNKIGNQGVQLLANTLTRHNHRLKELYLNGNQLINDCSIDSLVQMLKSNRSLKTFRIDQCNLSKKTRKKLRRIVRWKLFFSIQT